MITFDIDKDTFVKFMEQLRAAHDMDVKLSKDFGVNLDILCNFIGDVVTFISHGWEGENIKANSHDPYFVDDFSFFMYELDFGRNYKEGDFIIDGIEFPLDSIEAFYNYLCLVQDDFGKEN